MHYKKKPDLSWLRNIWKENSKLGLYLSNLKEQLSDAEWVHKFKLIKYRSCEFNQIQWIIEYCLIKSGEKLFYWKWLLSCRFKYLKIRSQRIFNSQKC